MTKMDRKLNKLMSRKDGRYAMKKSELEHLCRAAKGDPFRLALSAFRYGFEKGRRCERAKHKGEERVNCTITPQGMAYLEGTEAAHHVG